MRHLLLLDTPYWTSISVEFCTLMISTDEFTKLFQGRRLSESLFESKTVAKRVIYEESVPYFQTDSILMKID